MVAPFEEAEDEGAEVTLEMGQDGNQFLHLVLPAHRINFLNGMDSESTFFSPRPPGKTSQDSFYGDEDQPVMVEIGCKVFEVNRVKYQSAHMEGKEASY